MADSRKTLGEFLEARTPGSGKDRISMNPDKGSDNILNEGDDLGIDPFTDGHLLNFDADDVSLLSDYLYFLVSEYQYIRGSEGSGQPSNSYRPANSTSEAVSAHKGDNLQNDHANAVAYAVDSDSTTFLEYLFLFFITEEAAEHASLNPLLFAHFVKAPCRDFFIVGKAITF